MICAIHQPNFAPYLGFISKFKQSDVFVLYDHVQYVRNDYHNRNRLKVNGAPYWLTIPVKNDFGQKINEARFTDNRFIDKHLQLIKQNYGKTPYFAEVYPDIEAVYKSVSSDLLSDLTIPLIMMLFNRFDSSKKVVLSSELNLNPEIKSTLALVEVCQKLGADKYLSGPGAKEYLEEDVFNASGIELVWQDFHHPEYKQSGKEFIPNLSVLDALFNLGYKGTYNLL